MIDQAIANPRYVFSNKIAIGQTSNIVVDSGEFSIIATDLALYFAREKKFDYTGYLVTITI